MNPGKWKRSAMPLAAALYSGTLGAAKEGALYGIPSIGFSLDNIYPNADFSPVERFFHRIFENFLKFPPADGTFLNVNFPAIPPEEIKGIKFAAQGMGRWTKYTSQATATRIPTPSYPPWPTPH